MSSAKCGGTIFLLCLHIRKNNSDTFDRAKPVTEPERSESEVLRTSKAEVPQSSPKRSVSKPAENQIWTFQLLPCSSSRFFLAPPDHPKEAPASPSSRAKHPRVCQEGISPSILRSRKSLPKARRPRLWRAPQATIEAPRSGS